MPDLPAGDYIFMAFLLRHPRSAYDIKKAMERSVSHFWSTAHSQVYQQASRLVRDGFVTEIDAVGPRKKKLLKLTPKGKRHTIAWLKRPGELPRFYSECLVKLFFGDVADDLDATMALVQDQAERAGAMAAVYEAQKGELEDRGLEFALMTLEVGIASFRAAESAFRSALNRLEKMRQEQR